MSHKVMVRRQILDTNFYMERDRFGYHLVRVRYVKGIPSYQHRNEFFNEKTMLIELEKIKQRLKVGHYGPKRIKFTDELLKVTNVILNDSKARKHLLNELDREFNNTCVE